MVYNNVVISGILGIIFMKKIIALLTALLIAPSAMAIIYSEDTSDPAFLQNKGYSQSLIRTIDMKKYHATGSENTYEKYYKEKFTSELLCKKTIKRWPSIDFYFIIC